jgi:hypothetical protein
MYLRFPLIPLRIRAEVTPRGLTEQADRPIVVDPETGRYPGHPTACLLGNGKTMLSMRLKLAERDGMATVGLTPASTPR